MLKHLTKFIFDRLGTLIPNVHTCNNYIE